MNKGIRGTTKCEKCGRIIVIRNQNKNPKFCRHCYHYEWAKRKRKERVKNKCCASCGKKLRPIIKIPYRCKSCNDKQNQRRK